MGGSKAWINWKAVKVRSETTGVTDPSFVCLLIAVLADELQPLEHQEPQKEQARSLVL